LSSNAIIIVVVVAIVATWQAYPRRVERRERAPERSLIIYKTIPSSIALPMAATMCSRPRAFVAAASAIYLQMRRRRDDAMRREDH